MVWVGGLPVIHARWQSESDNRRLTFDARVRHLDEVVDNQLRSFEEDERCGAVFDHLAKLFENHADELVETCGVEDGTECPLLSAFEQESPRD